MKRQAYEFTLRRKRNLLLLLCSVVLTIGMLVLLDRKIRPAAEAICADECKRAASELIERSIAQTLAEAPCTEEQFATLLYNPDGTLQGIETNARSINAMQTLLLHQVNAALRETQDTAFTVSLGTVSGVWLFSGRGPSVQLRLTPVGHAQVQLISSLESAGINQTCHTLRAEVTVHLAAAIPFYQAETDVTYEYLLTETMLLGAVPESYAVFGGTPDSTRSQ